MKKILYMSILSCICSVLGCRAQDGEKFRSVGTEEFAEIIEDTAVVRLDVRTEEEYAAGHIAGAALADVLRDDFLETAVKTLPRGKTVALYCRSGRRSKKAAALLAGEGYDVVELSTGWLGWTRAGYGEEPGKKEKSEER